MTANQDRRERMWDAVYAAVFAKLWTPPPEVDHDGPPVAGIPAYSLLMDEADREAAGAADDAIERLDRDDSWGPGDPHE